MFSICLPGSLINHVSFHDQQAVSNTALFVCQAVSSIMFHPMKTGSEWHCFISLPGSLISIVSHPMTNRKWVTLLYSFARQAHQSHFIPWPTGSEWHYFISLPGSLINHVSSMTNSGWVTIITLFLSQAVSSIMFHPTTNRKCVTLLYFFPRWSHQSCFIPWPTGSEWHSFISLFHPMTNREWVTLLYFFARQSHQSCFLPWPTVCEWHCFISLPGSLINHVSSHDQQPVSDTTLFLCQAVSSIMFHPMTNREWVTLLYFFARQSHQSCFIPWPTVCEWHCFISLPGSLINHVSSHDQQPVSDTTLFLCQAVSSIMFHPLMNREWVTLLYFFARQPHQSCFQQEVSVTALFLCQAVSSIMFHPLTNRKWVSLLYFFARQSHQSCFIP